MTSVTELRTNQDKDFASDLDEIAREGARRMLAEALETEVADYIARNQERDESGRSQVVRNDLYRHPGVDKLWAAYQHTTATRHRSCAR
jgi:hypothetical protein